MFFYNTLFLTGNEIQPSLSKNKQTEWKLGPRQELFSLRQLTICMCLRSGGFFLGGTDPEMMQQDVIAGFDL